MQTPVLFFRTGVIGLILLFLATTRGESPAAALPPVTAQPPVTEIPAAKPAAPDEFNQPGLLLKSYLHVVEQLHAAELTIANSRLEAETAARLQAAAYEEKLEALRAGFAAERERLAVEAQRTMTAQERQRNATEETNHIILWVAVAFGGVGLLTMLTTTMLQWWGIKRMTQVTAQHQQPFAPQQAWLTPENRNPSDDAVTSSNQRLISVIDRMERRILELEHSTAHPLSAPADPIIGTDSFRNAPAALDQAARIAALLAKGRSLLNSNKAQEAVACYDEILAIDANLPEALVKKGSALERLKQDHEAIECYDRAIKADRNMALAYLSKGGVFNRLQRFEEAVECYEKALQVEKEGKQTNVLRVSVSGEWPANGSSVPA